MTPEHQPARLGKTYVRPFGRQLGRFIEFDFIVNDDTLSVELVMPEDAFERFCAFHNAEILPPRPDDDGNVIDFDMHRPGLYRAPAR
ncbi:MAG: phenol hydroxylase [Rhodobacterales bacterium]|nr:MAG: phenol hydroxylase [Rhodobacterales bacterium]